LGELNGSGAAGHRVLRDLQQGAVGGQGQVGGGHLADQGDLGRVARLAGREVLLLGGAREVAQLAEQVEFVGADARAERVLMDVVLALAGGRDAGDDAGRFLAERCAGGGVHVREQVCALDLILRPRGGDVGHGRAQVAIVGQRLVDDGLEPRIGEEVPPADHGLDVAALGSVGGTARKGGRRR
jgi:hypothetical protein